MNRGEAMTTPRALLYVATEAGGAACWVDEIRTIEDDADGGCTIWLHADFEGENIAIESTWSTQQVIDALRDMQNRVPGMLCVPRAVEATKAEGASLPNILKQCPDDPPITVTVCDSLTGVRTVDTAHGWWWWGGPGRYDKARGALFGKQLSYPTMVEPPEHAQRRYILVMVSGNVKDTDFDQREVLAYLNRGYPADLLARFDISEATLFDYPPVIVTICDTTTGQRVESNAHSWSWWWVVGKDDNARRKIYDPSDDGDYPTRGKNRFLITAMRDCIPDHPGGPVVVDLAALNRGYPADLLARFDIPTEVQP